MKTTCILQNVARIVGTIQLISGIVVWTGNGEALVISHIVLGSILTLALFALAYQAYRAKVSLKLVLVAAVWGLESAYGTFRGDLPVLGSLATLAYQKLLSNIRVEFWSWW